MWGQSSRTVVLLSTDSPCAGLTPGFLRQPDIELLSTPEPEQARGWLQQRAIEMWIRELPREAPAVDELVGPWKDAGDRVVSRTPMIVVGDVEQRSSALAAGADAFVSRPILQSEYFETLRRFIRLPRRASLRQRVNLRFRYRIGERSGQVFSRDLSASGAFLRTDLGPAPGTRLTLEFALPGDSTVLSTEAVVRRTTPFDPDSDHCCGFAVEFCGLRDEDLARLERFVERRAPRPSLFGRSS